MKAPGLIYVAFSPYSGALGSTTTTTNPVTAHALAAQDHIEVYAYTLLEPVKVEASS